MSFDIPIEIKPGSSKQVIAGIGSELDKLEGKGKKTGDSLSDALAGVQREFEQMRAAAGRATGALSSSFGSMADAIRRTENALERIRGPMREHEQEMQAISMLYRQGRINAAEYSREVDRLNASVGRTPKQSVGASILGALPGGAAVAGGAAGLAAAGAQAAVGAAHEIGQMADAYTNLGNRLDQVAKGENNHAMLMERTRIIANATRSEWGATGETFVRLTKATGDLGLSQERTLRLTETISKAFAKSGASASESSAAMLQLTQAFASGKLQGDEFRSLAEAVPDVLDFVAKEMGVSRGALKQLGSEGKITSDVLVRAFERAQESIDAGFAKSAPTLSQQWTVFKNDATAAIGKLAQDSNLLPFVTEKLNDVAKALERVSTAAGVVAKIKNLPGVDLLTDSFWDPDVWEKRFQKITDPLGENTRQNKLINTGWETQTGEDALKQSPVWQLLDANRVAQREAYIAQVQRMIDVNVRMQEIMGESGKKGTFASDALAKAISKMTLDGIEEIGQFADKWADVFSRIIPSSTEEAMKAMGGLGRQTSSFVSETGLKLALFLNGGVLPKSMDSWAQKSARGHGGGRARSASSNRIIDNPWEYSGSERVQQGIDAVSGYLRNQNALGGIGDQSAGALGADIEKATNDAAEASAAAFKRMTENWQNELRLQREAMDPWKRGLSDGWDAVRKQATDVSGAITQTMTNAYKGMEDALVSLVTTGKASFSDLVNSIMADLARLATRQLLMSLIALASGGGGAKSVFGTGATQAWGPGRYGGGHATGGSWKAPSTGGGPDSIPVMFRMSPGETAHFTPQGAAAQGGGEQIVNQIHLDDRQLTAMIDTPAGRKAIANVIRLNPGMFPFGRR